MPGLQDTRRGILQTHINRCTSNVNLPPRLRGDDTEFYLPLHSFATSASSATTVLRIAEGVREKRGAGAGCTTPSTSTKILRSAMCGCFGASDSDSTGAKQTSVPSMIAHHSARGLDLNTAFIFSFIAGQFLASIWPS